ncbi:MAG: hypothetical protein G01um101417_407 [Parcubacteria group bacterium Gr01-1014_17]|nr:MAG: hypothetical protein G01um101417_407 [Parcubacteria group bacterium Gr01-1014_17]
MTPVRCVRVKFIVSLYRIPIVFDVKRGCGKQLQLSFTMIVCLTDKKKKDLMQNGIDIPDIKAMSLAEACASTGKRPEQFPENKKCAGCNCILSRYNPYMLCNSCQRAIRTVELKKVNSALPQRNGHIYWSASVMAFQERTPLPQHEQVRENIFAR